MYRGEFTMPLMFLALSLSLEKTETELSSGEALT